MSVVLEIDRNSDWPIYRQIVAQIKQQISLGDLPAGTRLPPVRQLAESIGVTRLTVHNAYSELQSYGWVEARVGSGTFVKAGLEQESLLAAHLQNHKRYDAHYCSDMHRIIHLGQMQSLAYAVPDMSLVPGEEIIGIMNLHREEASSLLHYGGQDGDMELRIALTPLLAERGVVALPENILITNGATQGLALITQLLAQSGDSVIVEHPTYVGQMKAFEALGLNVIGVGMDQDGICIDELEVKIKQYRPRFLSLIPNYHNPTGILLSDERRLAILGLAERYDLYIIEDDVYALLSYDAAPPPALKKLDRHDRVIYISSISKTLAPGLRIGFLVAPTALQSKLAHLKWATELSGSPLIQRALAIYLREGRFKQHLRRVLPIYRNRRDAMIRSLQRHMPKGVSWTVPGGGFCVWICLPDKGHFDDLYPAALQHGIAYSPHEAFFLEPDGNYHIRLCFSADDEINNDNAVAILAQLISERLHTSLLERKIS